MTSGTDESTAVVPWTSPAGASLELRFPARAELVPRAHATTLSALCASPGRKALEIHCRPSSAGLRVWASRADTLTGCAHVLRSAWPTVTTEDVPEELPRGFFSSGFEAVMRYDPAIPLVFSDGPRPVEIVDGVLSLAADLNEDEFVLWQIVLSPVVDTKWPERARAFGQRVAAAAASTADRRLAAAIEEKAGQPQALAALRAVALSPHPDSARSIAHRLKGTLRFGAYHNDMVAIAAGPSDSFMQRVRLRASGNVPLSAPEIAALWGPGSGARPAHVVLGGPPTLFLERRPLIDGVRIGRARSRRGEVEVRLPVDGSAPHTLVIGETGTGKSNFLEHLLDGIANRGMGGVAIDPKGGLFERLVQIARANGRHDLQVIDLAAGGCSRGLEPVRWARSSTNRALLVEHVTATILGLSGSAQKGPRMEGMTRSSIDVLSQTPDKGLMDIPRLLLDRSWRRGIFSGLPDSPARQFLESQLDRTSPSEAQTAGLPVVNVLAPLLSNPYVREMFDAEPQVDLQQLLDTNGLLLVNAAEGKIGPPASRLLCALLPSVLYLTAAGRAPRADSGRGDFWILLDEFQRVPDVVISHLLSESRAFNIKLCLATQYLGQVPIEVRAALQGNVGAWVVFRVGGEDSRIVAERFGDRVDPCDLMAQQNFRATIKIAGPGALSSPFTLWTDPPLPFGPEPQINRIMPQPGGLANVDSAATVAALHRSRRTRPDVDEDN